MELVRTQIDWTKCGGSIASILSVGRHGGEPLLWISHTTFLAYGNLAWRAYESLRIGCEVQSVGEDAITASIDATFRCTYCGDEVP